MKLTQTNLHLPKMPLNRPLTLRSLMNRKMGKFAIGGHFGNLSGTKFPGATGLFGMRLPGLAKPKGVKPIV